MDLLCASFKHIQKEDANTHYTGLIQKIFKKGFDCRTLFIGDSDLMTDMEEMSIKAFSSLVLKLSENSFRPLYLEVSCLILITATHCHTCDNQHMNIGELPMISENCNEKFRFLTLWKLHFGILYFFCIRICWNIRYFSVFHCENRSIYVFCKIGIALRVA